MKIAFLFLIYDTIHFEEVWYEFFKNIDPEKYVIYIHYKTHRTLQYFEHCKLKNCIPTNYVIDISIAKAHSLLIKEAMKDPLVFKTINLSQSCIPFKSFNYVYDFLTKDENSHFNSMPMSDWSIAVTGPAVAYIKREEIHKAANWFILNRNHANCCLEHVEYMEYFKDVHSPEEFMFITLLKKHLPEKMICTNYSAEGATTFTNWDSNWGMVYKYPSDFSIKTYYNISEEELNYLMESPCLFGRKFEGDCRVGDTLLSNYTSYMKHINVRNSLHIITVATKQHPMLDLLIQQVKDAGETLTILGLELNKTIGWEATGNLGLKLKLVHDFVNTLPSEDVVLFMDAYDVLFKGNTKDILERYTTFKKSLVFGAETTCFPDEFHNKYPEHTKDYPFRYLNSGLFIGKVGTLRECFQNYEYVDGINDQAWWKQKFLDRPDLIELDYNNVLFLNCYQVNKHSIVMNDTIQYGDKMPLFLHFNGPSKAMMNRFAKLVPNPYFTLFPHVSMDYYLENGGE